MATIARNSPDIATRLANAQIQENRLVTLHQFEEMLSDEMLSESDRQSFFENNE